MAEYAIALQVGNRVFRATGLRWDGRVKPGHDEGRGLTTDR
jgi:hypothetical protein